MVSRNPIGKLIGGRFVVINAPEHGTSNIYRNWGCRCIPCKEAHTKHYAEYMKKVRAKPVPNRVHGTLNGYNYYGCRCDLCRLANSAWMHEYRKRKRKANADSGTSRRIA